MKTLLDFSDTLRREFPAATFIVEFFPTHMRLIVRIEKYQAGWEISTLIFRDDKRAFDLHLNRTLQHALRVLHAQFDTKESKNK